LGSGWSSPPNHRIPCKDEKPISLQKIAEIEVESPYSPADQSIKRSYL
jgi:hypothetical protein